MKFLIRAVMNAFTLWVTILLIPGIKLVGSTEPGSLLSGLSVGWQEFLYLVLAGAILALVNTFVRPIVKLLSLPFYVLTLGLFFLVVNAAMLALTAWLTGFFAFSLVISGFWSAVFGGIIIGIVNTVLELVVPDSLTTGK